MTNEIAVAAGLMDGFPPSPEALVGLGIHGQLIYADRAARTVVAKFSSWPDPQHTSYLLDTLRACAALAAALTEAGAG
ncbi:MAG: hypothetical protein ABSB59_02060 [Streptosporangiaceae bacterium]|jgi:CubicO group peptidase (beta-lactamase class C family)